MNTAVSGKTMENVRKNRDQQKKEETTWCQNQIIILKNFRKKIGIYRNGKS